MQLVSPKNSTDSVSSVKSDLRSTGSIRDEGLQELLLLPVVTFASQLQKMARMLEQYADECIRLSSRQGCLDLKMPGTSEKEHQNVLPLR